LCPYSAADLCRNALYPLLAWIFLGEPINLKAAVGLIFAGAGILLVQVRWMKSRPVFAARLLAKISRPITGDS
jgi:drug/metabolite transporter (DMT)-like permease